MSTTKTDPLPWIAADYGEFKAYKASLYRDNGQFPYFKTLAQANSHYLLETTDRGREVVNLSGYDYLGLNLHPSVTEAAQSAIETYGTSTAASRAVSGELAVHGHLERRLARFLGVEACVCLVSGHGTNVTALGHLFGPSHTLFCDQFAHNSIELGARLSGAKVIRFRHNDLDHLEELLSSAEPAHSVVCVEGLYSMDGDLVPLPGLLDLKSRFGFAIYMDEAHSIGTVGATGRGVCEFFDVDPSAIEVRMGTLSKSLASCGGFIAGSHALVEYMKFTSPAVIFSTGLPAPLAAAALAALEVLDESPSMVDRLRDISAGFRAIMNVSGPPTPIVPMRVSSDICFAAARRAQEQGVRVFPITFPAVPKAATRFRCFLCASHRPEDLARAAAVLYDVAHEEPSAGGASCR